MKSTSIARPPVVFGEILTAVGLPFAADLDEWTVSLVLVVSVSVPVSTSEPEESSSKFLSLVNSAKLDARSMKVS